ncbi:hypothetical protein PanWU01x14_131820 [Parasponia andersonii]|uniref:Pollen Ole e 1 allergen and extensin family protein n=1 Tax=Parasponia andersonii TaxID=3476 RepID=A0A2P5CQH5_PARAD|nr:hypothetical protein PanWU01x14_131820 [Parasponia andersonii]
MAYLPVLLCSLMLLSFMSSIIHCHNSPHNLPISGNSTSNSTTNSSNIIADLLPLNIHINVIGVLDCKGLPPNRMPPLFPQLNGVNLIFTCDNGQTTLARAVTDNNGVYNFAFDAVDIIVFILSRQTQSSCGVIARLPILGCAVYPPAGIIRAPLDLLQTSQDILPDGRHRVVHQYTAGKFSYYRP